jgi:methylenetetrahydrofolate dehydrogenase (NADP+)/methenyltetrahydrofolate cyclohydrolase
MTAIVMDAREIHERVKAQVKKATTELQYIRGAIVTLCAILVGDDPISQTYVSMKQKDCAEVGIDSKVHRINDLPLEEREQELIKLIGSLNDDPKTHGILIQMPFPKTVREERVFEKLSPLKDVDGLTPQNLGKLLRHEYTFDRSLIPCTPKGVINLLQNYSVDPSEKEIAIIGRSVLVGEPLRKLLQDLNGTATCYHTKSKSLEQRISEADIVVAAVGRPPELFHNSGFRLKSGMVKRGSVVVGVGVRKDASQNKMLFDVDVQSLREVCSYITPNINGVGLMTRAMLLENTMIAARGQLMA